jgi:hypothetical protein
LQGGSIKIQNFSVWMTIILLAIAVAVSGPVMAERDSGNLTVSAVILSTCHIDNTSLNFFKPQKTNPDKSNNMGPKALIPVSVTCNNAGYNNTYLLSSTSAKNLYRNVIEVPTGSNKQSIVTIYYD